MYGAAHVKKYLKISQAETGWESVAEEYNITRVLHDPNSVLSKVLMEKKERKLIYSNNIANVFVNALPEYEEIIQKYPTVKPFKKEK